MTGATTGTAAGAEHGAAGTDSADAAAGVGGAAAPMGGAGPVGEAGAVGAAGVPAGTSPRTHGAAGPGEPDRTSVSARPATAQDAEAASEGLPDLLPDRWRPGNNRRSFLVEAGGTVLGHCRGIDNDFHPASRSLVLETVPGFDDDLRCRVEDALLGAQIAVSTVPLRMKVYASDAAGRALAARHRAVAIQACPPWRYRVGPELRQWAAAHRHADDAESGALGAGRGGAAEPDVPCPVRPADVEELRDLEVAHYTAQHARWSPAAAPEVLRDELGEAYDGPAGTLGLDVERSVVLRRGGRLVAAGVVWPSEEHVTGPGAEVSLLSDPAEGPTARADKEACLAAVLDRCQDGDVLCLDSHLTERTEIAMMREVPGLDPAPGDGWMVILDVPVGRERRPWTLPAALVPDEASWIREFIPGASDSGSS